MSEEFLQYIWEYSLYDSANLQSTAGQPVEVIHPGKRNLDSGPDFFNARIKISDTTWAGNIEIHRKASDWLKHNHNQDKAYNNVILHIVEHADKPIYLENGEEVPVIELTYPDHLKLNYQRMLDSKSWIPCEEQFFKIDPILVQLGFNRLMIERLEQKTSEISERLIQNNNDWNETFYVTLAKMFGFKVNSIPFELLAKTIPLRLLSKHKESLFQTEALLFGCSGLLNQQLLGDDYFLKLRDEFSFLYSKYQLKPIGSHLWKFMRLRPVNFPTIRIAQFAALVHQSKSLFSSILEIESLTELKEVFKVKASDYWTNHYNFNKNSSNVSVKELGDDSINTLIINVVVPFLFVYGEKQEKHFLKDRSLEFLDQLHPEKNSVISGWEKIGIQSKSAFETQALLQLKNLYCDKKQCLKCQIGVKLIKS